MAAAAADPLRIIVGIPQKTGRNAKYDPFWRVSAISKVRHYARSMTFDIGGEVDRAFRFDCRRLYSG